MTKKVCDVQYVEYSEYTDIDFREVGSFFIKNSMGQRVYFMTKSREIAQLVSDEMYGVGHYRVSSGKMSKAPEAQSAVGRINSRSRAGSRPVK